MWAIRNRSLFLTIAAAIVVGSILIISVFGLRFGIDFTGGALTEVAYESEAEPRNPYLNQVTDAIRSNEFGLGAISVLPSQSEDGRDGFIIKTRDLTETERAGVHEAVLSVLPNSDITRFTSVGPVIGQELRDKAVWALIGVLAVIVLYVAYAFAGIGTPVRSWTYGIITIIVLAHDVLVPTALMSILGVWLGAEIDVLFVMALLAVLGYSVNDTIVIFDRVRENLVQNRTEHRRTVQEPGELEREEVTYTLTRPYAELVGEAVEQTMARSINTSLTTSLALIALFAIGGSVTQTFALILLAGVLAGAYSSICFASPLVVAYAKWRGVDVDNFDATDKAT